MPEPKTSMDEMAEHVRTALAGSDLWSFRELLDPAVTWGAPGSQQPSCRNRDQVLAWYERGRASGVRAQVNEVSVHDDKLLVSLTVGGSPTAQERGGVALRWQVLSVRGGRIVDIVGFDDRREALTEMGVSAP